VIITHHDGVPCWMVLNLGDSRTYRLDAAGLHRLTVDHSVVQSLIDSGVIEESASPPRPLKNMLSRALFGETEHSPDVSRLPMTVGDRILVCSDGIPSVLDDSTIHGVLQTVRDPQAAAERLLDTAKNAGARDDVTAVVVDAVAISPAAYSDRPTDVTSRADATTRAEPSRAEPSRAEPSRAEPTSLSPEPDHSLHDTRARWRAGDRDNAF
jgi:protein phosphatase